MKKVLKIATLALSLTTVMTTMTSCKKKPKGYVEGKFNISISAPNGESELQMLTTWKQGFEALHPDTNIIISQWSGKDTSAKDYVQLNSMQKDKITNIFYVTDDTVSSLAQKKNFVDLRKYYESSEETDYSHFYQSMFNTTSYNGDFRPTKSYTGSFVKTDADGNPQSKEDDREFGVFFAPREYNMPALVCNVETFNELGISIPEDDENWDMDAFVQLLQDISQTIASKSGTKWTTYRGIELNQTWEPIYTTFLKHYESDGLFKMDNTGSYVANLDSEKNISIYSEIINNFGNDAYKYAIDQEANVQFVNGKICMAAVSYPEVVDYMKKCDNLQFLPLPTKYVGAGCGGYGVYAPSCFKDQNATQPITQTVKGVTKKVVDICWEFLSYMMSKDGQNACGKKGLIQPIRKDLETSGEWLTSLKDKHGNPLNHKAFSEKEELSLNTYYFAEADDRSHLRDGVNKLFKAIFEPTAKVSDINSYINQAMYDIEMVL